MPSTPKNDNDCFALSTCSYFLALEQLRSEGLLSSFEDEHYHLLIKKSKEYTDRFFSTWKKYSETASKLGKTPVSLFSKYHFSKIDYEEEIGESAQQVGDGAFLVFNKWDIEIEAREVDVDSGGSYLSLSTDLVGADVSFPDDIVWMDPKKRGDLFLANIQELLVASVDKLLSDSGDGGLQWLIEAILDASTEEHEWNLSFHDKKSILEEPGDEEGAASFAVIGNIRTGGRSLYFHQGIAKEILDDLAGSWIPVSLPMSVNGTPLSGGGLGCGIIEEKATPILATTIAVYLSTKIQSRGLFLGSPKEVAQKISETGEKILEELLSGGKLEALSSEVEESTRKRNSDVIFYPAISSILGAGGGRKALSVAEDEFVGDKEAAGSPELNANKNLLESVAMDKGAKIQVELLVLPRSEEISFVGPKSAKSDQVAPVSIFSFAKEGISEEAPGELTKTMLTPREVSIGAEIGGSKLSAIIRILQFNEEDGVKEKRERNSMMGYFLVDRNRENGRNPFPKNCVLDEADKGSSGKGGISFAKNVGQRKSNYIVAASGTLISGYPADVVSQSSLIREIGPREREAVKSELTKQCGIYEITSKILLGATVGLSSGVFADRLEEAYRDFIEMKKSKSPQKNSSGGNGSTLLFSKARQIVEDVIIRGLVEENFYTISDFEDIETGKEGQILSSLFGVIEKKEKSGWGSMSFAYLFEQSLFESRKFSRQVPGVSSPLALAEFLKSQGGVVSSIMSREGLSGEREMLFIEDLDVWSQSFPKVGKPRISMSEFIENNHVGIRVVQAMVGSYSRDNFLPSVYGLLNQQFSEMVKLFTGGKKKNKENLAILCRYMNERILDDEEIWKSLKSRDHVNEDGEPALTPHLLLTYLNKETTTGKTGVSSLYGEYLVCNGEMDASSTFLDLETVRKWVFKEMLHLYDRFCEKVILLGEGHFALSDQHKISDVPALFIPPEFRRTGENRVKILSTEKIFGSLSEGYPEGLVFSAKLDLCPVELSEFIEPDQNGYRMPYRLVFHRQEENDILDVVGSLGAQKIIKEELLSRGNTTIATGRTFGAGLALLSAIKSAIEVQATPLASSGPNIGEDSGSSANKKIEIIFNVPSGDSGDFNMRDLLSRINYSLPDKSGVEITKVMTSKIDDAIKASIAKGNQTVLISNYSSISRGKDLSMMRSMIVLGGMERSSDAIQFFSRQFSISRKNGRIFLYGGGKDAMISTSADKISELLAGEASRIFSIQRHAGSALSPDNDGVSHISTGHKSDTAMELLQKISASGAEGGILLGRTRINSINELARKKLEVYNAFQNGVSTSIIREIPSDETGGALVASPSEMAHQAIRNRISMMMSGETVEEASAPLRCPEGENEKQEISI